MTIYDKIHLNYVNVAFDGFTSCCSAYSVEAELYYAGLVGSDYCFMSGDQNQCFDFVEH